MPVYCQPGSGSSVLGHVTKQQLPEVVDILFNGSLQHLLRGRCRTVAATVVKKVFNHWF